MARSDSNTEFDRTSFLYGTNAHFIEEMEARFAADPQSVGSRVAGLLFRAGR